MMHHFFYFLSIKIKNYLPFEIAPSPTEMPIDVITRNISTFLRFNIYYICAPKLKPDSQTFNLKKMKKTILSAIAVCSVFVMVRCTSNTQTENTGQTPAPTVETKKDVSDKGIGPYKEVKLTYPLDEEMITQGQFIFKSKCFACHKLTDEKLVGPGWKGVTTRRASEWIMNFITNTDVMLDKDLVAQQLVTVCIARMPNQKLSPEEVRNVLEFMRKNDGKH